MSMASCVHAVADAKCCKGRLRLGMRAAFIYVRKAALLASAVAVHGRGDACLACSFLTMARFRARMLVASRARRPTHACPLRD